jgi:DNA polymerase-3 subunit alpha
MTVAAGTVGLIPFGLSAVRNVGENLVRQILEEREKNGSFVDFYDFCERVDPSVLNKRAIESLIKAGAFDSLGHPRRGLLSVYEQIVDITLTRRRERDQGVMSLFGDGGPGAEAYSEKVSIPDLEFDKAQRLKFEKEMLGLYVSDHPLMGAEGMLRRRSDCSVADLAERQDGESLTVGGVITNVARKYTKKGDLMAVFNLEDLGGAIEVMVFPKVMSEQGFKLADDALVLVRGRVDGREDVAKLMCLDVTVIEAVSDASAPLRIRVNPTSASEQVIEHLKRILTEHPGDTPVMLHLGERQVLRLPAQFSVDAGNGLAGEIRVLLGPGAIVA